MESTVVAQTKSNYVTEHQVVVLDGKRLPLGFDLSSLKTSNYNIEIKKPTTTEQLNELKKEYGMGAENGVVLLTSITEQSKVYDVVDTMPYYLGGYDAMMSTIRGNLLYPPDAQNSAIQGNVIVRFVVKHTGDVGNVEVLKGLCFSLDQEAIRVVKLLKGWKPGTNQGKPVDVYFTLPIRFALNN